MKKSLATIAGAAFLSVSGSASADAQKHDYPGKVHHYPASAFEGNKECWKKFEEANKLLEDGDVDKAEELAETITGRCAETMYMETLKMDIEEAKKEKKEK